MAFPSDITGSVFPGNSLVSRRTLESSVMSPVLWWHQLPLGYSFSSLWVHKQACLASCSGYFGRKVEIKERPHQGQRKMTSSLVKQEGGNHSGEGLVSVGRVGDHPQGGRFEMCLLRLGLASRSLGISQRQTKSQEFLIINLGESQKLLSLQFLFWKLFNCECQWRPGGGTVRLTMWPSMAGRWSTSSSRLL